jgi:hypothetical protein
MILACSVTSIVYVLIRNKFLFFRVVLSGYTVDMGRENGKNISVLPRAHTRSHLHHHDGTTPL